MLAPYIVSAIFVVTVVALCFAKPNAGRILLGLFFLAMGVLILGKHKAVKIGLLGTIIFIVALAPVNTLQFVWLGLVVGQAYLLTKEFDVTFLDILRKWRARSASR